MVVEDSPSGILVEPPFLIRLFALSGRTGEDPQIAPFHMALTNFLPGGVSTTVLTPQASILEMSLLRGEHPDDGPPISEAAPSRPTTI